MAEDGAEYTAKTVGDAIAQAESALGVTRDQLEVEIVAAGRSGVFGIGAEPARVRVRRRMAQPAMVAEPEEERAAQPRPEPPVTAPTAVDEAPPETVSEAEPQPAGEGGDLANEAASVLRELLRTMGFNATVVVRSAENPVMLGITGENLGVLIGRRGDNLSSLQFMVNLILSKHRRQWPRVVVDVENYRARREESLRSLADRIAYRVRRNQRPFTLEAMPAGDRRVIHLTLRDAGDIETYSIGEGVARRVVIAPRREGQPAGSARRY